MMAMDYRAKLIEELEVMMRHAQKEKETFKVRAYSKVIGQLKSLTHPVRSMADVAGVEGIGAGIKKKIEEILATGELAAAEELKLSSTENFSDSLMKIYGVGPAKAKAVIAEHPNVRTIADLRAAVLKDKKLLNEKQKIGLRYYEDLLERIPREEMYEHERIVINSFSKVNSKFIVSIVGSFRRNAATSGDIDALVTLPESMTDQAENLFKEAIKSMTDAGYITHTLALGAKKCMGISRVDARGRARRLDLLLTTPAEYPYAILYFTGSDKFNIRFRREVIKQGFSLNEHGLKLLKETKDKVIPTLKTERDIFDYFKITYVTPAER